MVSTRVSSRKSAVIKYTVTTILLLLMIFPYIYMILNSFAAWDQVDQKLIPTKYTLDSWKWLLFNTDKTAADAPWLLSFRNTFIVATCSTALMMLSSVMIGYALAKIDFKGKKIINNMILFQMFFPGVILLVPQFLMITKMGGIDTFAGMILPTCVSLWAVFMYTNFFKTIPQTLIESAKLDGASEFKILVSIVIPMSKNITTVIFLFLYTNRWTELLWDMIVSKSNRTITLNVLISQMFGPYGAYPGPMYAASIILSLPLIILFLCLSKRFKDGMQFSLK